MSLGAWETLSLCWLRGRRSSRRGLAVQISFTTQLMKILFTLSGLVSLSIGLYSWGACVRAMAAPLSLCVTLAVT